MKSLPMVERLKKEIDENHFDINLVKIGIPLENGKRAIAEDILQINVDQKYYLQKKYIERLILHPNFKKNYARIIVDRFTGEEKISSRVGGGI